MKVLHVISSGGMYGAEAVILNMSRMLNEGSASQRCSACFPTRRIRICSFTKRRVKEGIESTLISCKGQIDRTVIASIRELVKQTGADVVHAHGYKADVYVYARASRG